MTRVHTHTYTYRNTYPRILHVDLKLFGFCFFSMFTRTVAASKETRGKKHIHLFFSLHSHFFTFIHNTMTCILISLRVTFLIIYTCNFIKQVTRGYNILFLVLLNNLFGLFLYRNNQMISKFHLY